MYYYSDGITLLLFHCNHNDFEMIHWRNTGLTLEEHWGKTLADFGKKNELNGKIVNLHLRGQKACVYRGFKG